MAQLPSGRHVAIQATPLFALIEAACVPEAVITRLLQIETTADLFPFIDVMFFRETAETVSPEVAPGGHAVPPGIEAYASSYTLSTIRAAVAEWPAIDRQSFADYLASDRVQDLMAALLERVSQVKHQLGREGDFTLRLQALMWESGCHPIPFRTRISMTPCIRAFRLAGSVEVKRANESLLFRTHDRRRAVILTKRP